MIITRAPLRIPLGGGGTDLHSYYASYGGFILSVAINAYVSIIANPPRLGNGITLRYQEIEAVPIADQVQHKLTRCALQSMGIKESLDLVSISDIPPGTGLGSSGTFLVALLAALHIYQGRSYNKEDLAELACTVEIDQAGAPVGKHDQYIAALGGFTVLDIGTDGTIQTKSLPIHETTLVQFRQRVLLFYTGITRLSRDILHTQDIQTRQQHPIMLESLHRTKSLGYEIQTALESGNLDRFGQLLDQHWENKKQRAATISSEKVDQWYQMAKNYGAIGGKLMGAGGGGFLLLCCESSATESVRQAMQVQGLKELSYDFDFVGVQTLLANNGKEFHNVL